MKPRSQALQGTNQAREGLESPRLQPWGGCQIVGTVQVISAVEVK